MNYTKRLMQLALMTLLSIAACLAEASIPKFSILYTLKPPVQMPVNGVATAQYLVTNNTMVSRTLTMTPVVGVFQNVDNPDGCQNPFILGPGQSCLLTLQIVGPLMPIDGVHTGPEICKTIGPNDNRPDAYLCSKPFPGNELNVSTNGITLPATVVPSSTNLTFTAGVGGTITLTNTSTNVAAENIGVTFQQGTSFYITSNTCGNWLLPGRSCAITFNAPSAGTTSAVIHSQSMNMIGIHLTAVTPTISVSPSALNFIVGIGNAVTVTNTSGNGAVALNVNAIIPPGSTFVSSTNCPSLLADGASCAIFFDSSVQGALTVPIQGTNTNQVTVDLGAFLAPISVLPTSLNFVVDNPGSVTVTNNATSPALNIAANIPTGSSFSVIATDCPISLAPGASCVITFSSSSSGSLVVPIQGTNTTQVTVNLGAVQAPLSVSPSSLNFAVNDTGTVTITNNSTGVAYNIAANLPVGSGFSVSGTTCTSSLLAGASCTMTFTGTIPKTDVITIVGSNTTIASVAVVVQLASLDVTLTLLNLIVDNLGEVMVTNTSSVNAHNVAAHLPVGSSIAVAFTNCSSDLLPAQTCSIKFNSSAITTSPETIPIYGSDTNQLGVNISVSLAPISLSTNTLMLSPSMSGSITVTNNSTLGAAKVIAPIVPSGAEVSVINNCPASLAPLQSCSITFTASGSFVNPVVIPVQGTNTTTKLLTIAPVALTVSPLTLTILTGETGTLNITNTSETIEATNILPIIPPGSAITVGTNTCSPSLASGAHCSIEIIGGVLPESTSIAIQGSNTDSTAVVVNVLDSSLANITVTPTIDTIVADGVTPTTFTITNNAASAVTATNVTMTLPAAWTGVIPTVDAGCASLPPGISCLISLISTTAYLPENGIIVSGTNTTTPTIAIAFETEGGIVFNISGGFTFVASLTDNNSSTGLAFGSEELTDAVSVSNGSLNTSKILTADPSAPAALACVNFNGGSFNDWFLPAKNQLNSMYLNLFLKGFGNFSQGTPATTYYWSSTENNIDSAWFQSFALTPLQATDLKNINYRVRCIRRSP